MNIKYGKSEIDSCSHFCPFRLKFNSIDSIELIRPWVELEAAGFRVSLYSISWIPFGVFHWHLLADWFFGIPRDSFELDGRFLIESHRKLQCNYSDRLLQSIRFVHFLFSRFHCCCCCCCCCCNGTSDNNWNKWPRWLLTLTQSTAIATAAIAFTFELWRVAVARAI